MRHYFLFLSLLLSLTVSAQDVDETMLVGRWVRSSFSGEFTPYKRYGEPYNYSIQSPDVISFYDESPGIYQDDSLGMVYCCDPHSPVYEYNPETWQTTPTGEYEERWDRFGIKDYFITKNNILHISLDGGRLIQRFKIIAFDNSSMTLSTMNGKGTVIYVHEQTTGVRSVKRSKTDNDNYYSLKGVRMNSKPSKQAYIWRGKKYTP